MSSFMTRWSVLTEHPVGPDDRDREGVVSDAAVARWVERACHTYLEQCPTLVQRQSEGLSVRTTPGALPTGAPFGRASVVVVSASATEVFPDAFVISVRLRSLGDTDDHAANGSCTVTVVDGDDAVQAVDRMLRDELIALEHAAQHFN